ncbi:MAG: carboxyltransferase domain-containing protein [Pseudomonadota bacterium]
MPATLTAARIADDAFEFAVSDPKEAQALAAHLREAKMADDVVAGLNRVAVYFDPSATEDISAWLQTIKYSPRPNDTEAGMIEIGISYGGPIGDDLARVCEMLDLSRDDFIARHTATVHHVDMIGFTPGFSYLSGVPKAWRISRLETPRPRVAAGAVGLSAAYTGIYALQGPGGWPLIGQIDRSLFNSDLNDPFLLKPGQRVRFRAV